jgi:glutathione S-transferase
VQLISLPGSFYAARCRAALYAKAIECEVVAPPDGLGSAAHRAASPLGKVPVLVDGERRLCESQVICEYLEERFPDPPLLPADAWRRAQVRLACRAVDLYAAPPVTALWRRLRAGATTAQCADEVRACADGFAALVRIAALDVPANGVDLADCALAPVLWLARHQCAALGAGDPAAAHPALFDWWQRARAKPAIARVLGEMEAEVRRRAAAAP